MNKTIKTTAKNLSTKKVLILTTKMGHKQIAEAIQEEFLKRNWEAKIYFSKFAEIDFYQATNFFFPGINQFTYRYGEKTMKLSKFITSIVSLKKIKKIKTAIKNFHPHLVVSTYPVYSWSLEKLKKEGSQFLFFNVVANPRSIHPTEFSPYADLNIVYDQKAADLGKKWGINKVKAIGWPVRKRFYQPASLTTQKQRRKLNILLCAGSWGNHKIISFLPIFLKIPTLAKITLVAGNNKALFRAFDVFKKAVEKEILLPKNKLEIEIFPFVEELNKLMAKADLVLGKAGPNLLFDTVAAGKPFVAITHYGGQEDGNLEIIKEKGLGWVAEKPTTAREVLIKIVQNPKILSKIHRNILKERKYNISACSKIVLFAEKMIAKTVQGEGFEPSQG